MAIDEKRLAEIEALANRPVERGVLNLQWESRCGAVRSDISDLCASLRQAWAERDRYKAELIDEHNKRGGCTQEWSV